MRKLSYFAALFFGSLVFAACAGEEEDLFDQSAAERLNAVKGEYSEILESSKGGWAMEYYAVNDTITPEGYGYLLLNRYSDNGFVTVAMNNAFSNNVYAEDSSAWEIITDNGHVLTYNTYNNCLHKFSDPDDIPFTSEDETGRGAQGDYEFVLVDMPKDSKHLMFKGKKRGTYIRMTRLEDGTDFKTYLEDVQGFHKSLFPASAPNYCLLNLGGDSLMYMRNSSEGMPGIYPVGSDPDVTEYEYPFLITKSEGKYYLRFENAFKSTDGTDVQEFAYDEKAGRFVSVENSAYTIEGENPDSFIVSSVADGHSWRLTAGSEMSDNIKSAFADVAASFKSKNSTFNYLSFSYTNGQYVISVNYKPRRSGAVNVLYKYSLSPSKKGLTLTYAGPVNQEGENTLQNVPTVKKLLDSISGDYDLAGAANPFNLSKMKFTDSESKWFTLSYAR